MLRVSLFGHMTATADRRPLKLSAGTAALRLWAYLLLHRHEPLPRTHVAFTLFPDSKESEALAHVRRQLHVLQGLLPKPAGDDLWIVADRVSVQWNTASHYWLDVEEFEARCGAVAGRLGEKARRPTEARLERAMSLYSGELLIDYYDDWVLMERERLDRMHVEALAQLVCLRASEGDIRGAAIAADQLAGCDSLCEELHRLAMGLHYLAGDRGAALKAYGSCQRVLMEELDIEPLAETTRLAEAIRESGSAERIVGLLQPDLPVGLEGSALLPRRVPNNLRRQLTSFVGRERELAEIATLVSANRLVTLVGAGGSGKTRLALEAADRILCECEGRSTAVAPPHDMPYCTDGIWWVDFTAIDDPGLVPQAVATSLGLSDEPGRDLTDTLIQHVADRSMLLVLDNVEHVAESCGALADQLLLESGGVRVLATSREPLGLSGEVMWLVPPMSVPPDTASQRVADVAAFEAPALFIDRAHLHDPRFDVAEADTTHIVSLSRRLDGLPLAVELAAAQVSTMSVAQIANGLDDRLGLLSGGGPSVEPRHQEMRAVIEWSHETLSAPEQVLLRRLAVFRGGWTVDAAASVCAGDGIEGEYVAVLLTSLVGRSLIESATRDGARRLRMLATTRQFASEELDRSGEEDAVRMRHVEHFLTLAEDAEPELRGPDQAAWVQRLSAEHDNFRSAMGWSIGRGTTQSTESALRIAGALRLLWYVLGHLAEGRRWIEDSLRACPDAPPEARAKALNGAGILAYRQGDFEAARAFYEECRDEYARAGDDRGVGLVLGNLGMVATDDGDYAAGRALFEQSLAALEAVGDARGAANALGNLGTVASEQGDLEAARDFYERSLEMERQLEDPWGISSALHSLGRLAGENDEAEEARSLIAEAARGYREMGDVAGTADALCDLGALALAQEDFEESRRLLEEANQLFRDVGADRHLATSLRLLGRALMGEGRLERSADVLTESLALDRDLGDEHGMCMGLTTSGELCVATGDSARAARLWGSAQAHYSELGSARERHIATEVESSVVTARAELGDAAFDEELSLGREMSLERAVAFALGEEEPAAKAT